MTSEAHETTFHTSGGVFVAAAYHPASVVDASGAQVEGLEGNEVQWQFLYKMSRRGTHLCCLVLAQCRKHGSD